MATCTACHGLSTTPGGGLNLLEGHSHADLVNRASTTVDGKMRVMPGNASESVLHLNIGYGHQLGLAYRPFSDDNLI